jgi:hypothetical protein
VETPQNHEEKPMSKTPGQIAYEAYWQTIDDDPPEPWDEGDDDAQAAWDDAAEAVMKHTKNTEE